MFLHPRQTPHVARRIDRVPATRGPASYRAIGWEPQTKFCNNTQRTTAGHVMADSLDRRCHIFGCLGRRTILNHGLSIHVAHVFVESAGQYGTTLRATPKCLTSVGKISHGPPSQLQSPSRIISPTRKKCKEEQTPCWLARAFERLHDARESVRSA